MNKTFIAIALFAAGINSVAAHELDQKFQSADGTTAVVVHGNGLAWGENSQNNFQVDAHVTVLQNSKVERFLLSVTGCEGAGGSIVEMNEKTGKPKRAGVSWIWDGYSMWDGIGQKACYAAAMGIRAKSTKSTSF